MFGLDKWLAEAPGKLWNAFLDAIIGLLWQYWWLTAIVVILFLAWMLKTFGWKGTLAAALVLLTLGAYTKGWNDHMAVLRGKDTVDPAPEGGGILDGIFRRPRPKAIPKPKKGKRTFNPDAPNGGAWE